LELGQYRVLDAGFGTPLLFASASAARCLRGSSRNGQFALPGVRVSSSPADEKDEGEERDKGNRAIVSRRVHGM